MSLFTAARARLLGLLGRRPPQRRAVARYAVACEARLDVDAGTYHVQVCDISQAGALLVLAEPLEPGARAQLRFPSLEGRPAVGPGDLLHHHRAAGVVAGDEQKAVAVLLALLSLGVKGLRLGPTLPGFLSPGVAKVLVDNFNIKPITTAQEDIAAMMAGN